MPNGNKKPAPVEVKKAKLPDLLEVGKEHRQKEVKVNTTASLTGRKISQSLPSPEQNEQNSRALIEDARKHELKSSHTGLFVLIPLALGAYFLHRAVTRDVTPQDVENTEKEVLEKKRNLNKNNKDAKAQAEYRLALSKLDAIRKELDEVKLRQVEDRKIEGQKLKEAYSKLNKTLKAYKKLAQKHNLSQTGRLMGLATGGTFALILMSYATSENVRQYFQTYFGIPDIGKFMVGGKLFIDQLRKSLERVQEGKSSLKEEFLLLSSLFDSLKNMKKLAEIMAKENPQNKFDPVLLNELAPYAIHYLFQLHAQGADKKELPLNEITDPEKRKQLYDFVSYLKTLWPKIREKFNFIKNNHREDETYKTVDAEGINLRAALSLYFYKGSEQRYWHEERAILAARARLIGWYPQAINWTPLGYKPFEWGPARFLAKWGTMIFKGSISRENGRLMYHYIAANERMLKQYNQIVSGVIDQPDVQKARALADKKEALYRKALTDPTKGAGSVAVAQAVQDLRAAEDHYQRVLKSKLPDAQKTALTTLLAEIDDIRIARVEAELANAHRMGMQAETAARKTQKIKADISRIQTEIAAAKKEGSQSDKLTALETKLKKAEKSLKHFEAQVADLKKNAAVYKEEINRRISAASRLEYHPNYAQIADQGSISADKINEVQKALRHNEKLIRSIGHDYNHPFWGRMSESVGLSRQQCAEASFRMLEESHGWKTFTGVMKGQPLKKIPIVKTVQAMHTIGRRGMVGVSVVTDWTGGHKMAVAETAVSMVPVIGDFVDLHTALITGHDWAGRKLDYKQRWLRGGIAGASLLANILTLGGGAIAKALLKGGSVGIKVKNMADKSSTGMKLVYQKGGWALEKASQLMTSGGKLTKGGLYLASYPLLGWTMYESAKPFLDQWQVGKILMTSGESGIRFGIGLGKVIQKIISKEPDILTKGKTGPSSAQGEKTATGEVGSAASSGDDIVVE